MTKKNYKIDLEAAQAEVEKIGTQMEAARVMQEGIENHKNAARQQIEYATRRLQCMD